MVSEAVFRAKPDGGEPIDDPSEDALWLLLDDLENGQGDFLIVEDLRDRTGQTFVQTAREDHGEYVVEVRAGGQQTHLGALVADVRAAHALLAGWTFDLPGWRESVRWAQVEL